LKKIIFIIFTFILFCSHAQIGGQSVYQFLNLTTSPRIAALGGKVLTVRDFDVNQAAFNPATINMDMHQQLSVNYANYFGDISYGTANYAFTFDRHIQTFHAGISYINYGTFDGRDELGLESGSFSGQEGMLSVGYSYNIPWTDLYVGTNVKFITSILENYSSFGVAADLGLLYVDEKNDINYALVVRNFGTQITTYAGLKEPLPFEIMLGISQELEHVPLRWHLTLENLQQWDVRFSNPARSTSTLDGNEIPEEVGFLNNMMRHVIVGAELFPEKSFNLRLGYNFRRAEELGILEQRNFSGLSFGFSIKSNKMRFDYSYARYTLAANTSMFGLTINLE
jgi:hypothetical protein